MKLWTRDTFNVFSIMALGAAHMLITITWIKPTFTDWKTGLPTPR